ncbi:MAG: hypothetical protein L3J71_02825 [Victivallaceae bacterium]|nr:hypothetical protein [Victivallaceae bacterium]
MKTNLVIVIFLIFGLCFNTFSSTNTGYPGRAEDKIAVQKNGDKVFIRSWFSPTQDVAITLNRGVNRQINYYRTAIIPATTPLTKVNFTRKEIIHYCHDDTPPMKIISTYIGANHGCSDARELLIPSHGLTVKDIGTAWQDSRGDVYYPIKIVNDSKIWVLGEDKGKNGIWRFNRLIKAGDFSRQSDGKKLTIKKAVLAQMTPAARITKQQYLINGKAPLKDGNPVICDYLDIIEEYDIIAPDSLLGFIKKNPGKIPNFIGSALDALYTNKTTYQFQPLGACFIENQIIPKRDFPTYYATPVMSMPLSKLNNYKSYECYIPKTKPFKNAGTEYDFNAIQDFTVPIKFSLSFKAANKNIDPLNPPNRFIQFLGQEENGNKVRKVGFAFGIVNDFGSGSSTERIKNVDEMCFIYRSYKTYPSILGPKAGTLKAGVNFNSRAYRQYFNPEKYKNPTAVYWHRQNEGIRLYIDYHQAVSKDIIKLPVSFTGNNITIVEKSPSIELLTKGQVPAQGIAVAVTGKQGYLVLQLSK